MGTVYQLIPVNPFGIPPLALKTYQESANRSQFMREVELWISLGTHPHIAHAIAYADWHGKPAVVADWYDRSLADVNVSKWQAEQIIELAIKLADGLDHAAKTAGVVHQDVKPSDVMLDATGAPRLTDFGMARFAAQNLEGIRNVQDIELTMRHTGTIGPVGGTPLYMAPELFFGASPSIKTDIYSLGVTLYEALTHEHPFLGEETAFRFRPNLRIKPLRRVANNLGPKSQSLIALIVTALELDPSVRPGSYDAFLSKAGHQKPVLPS
jgi:serine/threonine-protein kinase PknK